MAAAIFSSESASVDGPVLVRFTGVSSSFSNRMRRSWGTELTTNGSPACVWILRSRSSHWSWSSDRSVSRNSRSIRMPAASIFTSTRTSGRSTVS